MRQQYYVCGYCGSSSVGALAPDDAGCPEGARHRWDRLGIVGKRYRYQCGGCGLELTMDHLPNQQGCPTHLHHRWRRLALNC